MVGPGKLGSWFSQFLVISTVKEHGTRDLWGCWVVGLSGFLWSNPLWSTKQSGIDVTTTRYRPFKWISTSAQHHQKHSQTFPNIVLVFHGYLPEYSAARRTNPMAPGELGFRPRRGLQPLGGDVLKRWKRWKASQNFQVLEDSSQQFFQAAQRKTSQKHLILIL